MHWRLSHRADPPAVRLADRHYSRQKPGTPQFVKPGRCIVLLTADCRALWVSSWPFPEYVDHAWPGAWECSWFRNEGGDLSSELIREAVAVTRAIWGEPPALGMITFVDEAKVRGKQDPGFCFGMARFRKLKQMTKSGKIVWRLAPERMPEPAMPIGYQMRLVA